MTDAVRAFNQWLLGFSPDAKLARKGAAETIDDLQAELEHYRSGEWIRAADVNCLCRDMDEALNGVEGMAQQAALCDIAAQVIQRFTEQKVWVKMSCRDCNDLGVFSSKAKADAENFGWCSSTIEVEIDSEERQSFRND